MSLIDIGCNLTDAMFQGKYFRRQVHEPDLDVVLRRARDAGVGKIIVTVGQPPELAEALQLCSTHEDLYMTCGVHPTRCEVFEKRGDELMGELKLFIRDHPTEVVALGEMGLDYDRLKFCRKEIQGKWFKRLFELCEVRPKLPLFLHNRNTGGEFYEILKEKRRSFSSGVVHSFDGSLEDLRTALEFDDLYIGINGCSLKTPENLNVVKAIPLDRLMLETDAPWCGIKRSHASNAFVKT